MSEFRFDPTSFLIGFGSASGLSFILYRMRHRIVRWRQGAGERADRARRYAARTADVRYQIDIRNYCEQYHIGAPLTRLSRVLVEPRFIVGIKPYDTTGDAQMQDVFHVVPLIHKFPAIYAPYNIKTIGIEDLQVSDRHLALLGLPGSGRSTALAAIALWALAEIEFKQAEDLVQAAIDEEEAGLDEQQRAARRKERAEIQARALEQIAEAQRQASEAITDTEGEQGHIREIKDFRRLMPILVHFSDIVIDPETASRLDPAEPLVMGIQQNLRRLTALTVPRYVYSRLNSGQALVLLDGLDDLPPEEQVSRLAWLRRFKDAYPQCTIIVAGSAVGYHDLHELGFTPMFLRPWTDRDIQQYAEKWATVWSEASGSRRRPGITPDERTVRIAADRACGLTAMDITARIISCYLRNDEEVETLTRWDWYSDLATRNFTMREFSNNDDLADEALFAVVALATHSLKQHTFSVEEARKVLSDSLSGPAGEDGKAKAPPINIDQMLAMLIEKANLLERRTGARLSFTHPLLASFLASASLVDPEGETSLETVASAPEWASAIPFAIPHTPVESVNRAVVKRLSRQPDLLFQNLMDLATWMPCTPQESAWRGEVFKRLAAALLAPSQFPVLREWAAAALVSTRDRNALHILRQATRSTDPDIRALGCIGLGAMGDNEAIRDLRPMLEDDEMHVQQAAALALGALGSEYAVEIMVDGLYHGEENLRQAVAEALAAIPDPGHTILHQAAESDDMMARRAAVFGLARIRTAWALTDLYRRLLEDDQWYVRSAAEQVFASARPETREAATAHPPVEALDWIADWLEEHQVEIVEDQDSRQLLVHLLDQGDPAYQIAAAYTLAYTGYVNAIPALYEKLVEESDDVRSASYAALADFEVQVNVPFPTVL